MTEQIPRPGARQYGPRDLMLIRFSFLMGVVLFAGVIFYLHRTGGLPSDTVPDGLIYVPLAATAAALLALFPLRAAMMRATQDQQRITLMIVGWGLGEANGLAGAVYYWFTDNPRFLISGIFVLLASFMLFPIKRPE